MTPTYVFIGVVNWNVNMGSMLHKVGTGEFQSPERFGGLRYRCINQRLLSKVSCFSQTGHLLLSTSKISQILTGLGPPGSKYNGWTKDLQRNAALRAPTQPESGEWLRESGGIRILNTKARDGGIYGFDE